MFCRNCATNYTNANVAFANLAQNETCKSIYFDVNRLNLIQRTFDSSVALWNAASCSSKLNKSLSFYIKSLNKSFADCFMPNANSSVATDLSYWAGTFFNDSKVHQQCLADNKEGAHDICQLCADSYSRLNAYFNDIKANYDADLCFDIVDTVRSHIFGLTS